MSEDKVKFFIDHLLTGKNSEEKVTILRYCLEHHALGHPWADDDFVDSVLENIMSDGSLKSLPETASVAERLIARITSDFRCVCGREVTEHVTVSQCECGERYFGPAIKSLFNKETLDSLDAAAPPTDSEPPKSIEQMVDEARKNNPFTDIDMIQREVRKNSIEQCIKEIDVEQVFKAPDLERLKRRLKALLK